LKRIVADIDPIGRSHVVRRFDHAAWIGLEPFAGDLHHLANVERNDRSVAGLERGACFCHAGTGKLALWTESGKLGPRYAPGARGKATPKWMARSVVGRRRGHGGRQRNTPKYDCKTDDNGPAHDAHHSIIGASPGCR